MEIVKIDATASSTSKNKKSINNNIDDFNSKLESVRNSFIQSHSADDYSEEVKSALATIEKLLNMNITSKDYKGNGKLDIVNIMRRHGNKLSSSDTKDFIKSLDTLLENDLIEREDYVEVIQMLTLQNKYKNITDKLESDAINTITDAKANSKNTYDYENRI